MNSRLPAVLSARDLPLAELCGARLDGELFPLGDFWCPVDVVDDPAGRARAVGLLIRSSRAIAERLTAAWIYGLAPEPRRHHFCVQTSARMKLVPSPRLQIREVRAPADQLQTISDLRVTLPLRTAIDLARCPGETADDARVPLIAALLRLAGCTSVEPAQRLCLAPNQPFKAKTLTRLREVQRYLDEHPCPD
ncbi:hypothetical protein E3T28_11170 [Cryobacterium sinapicolor]|uniref:AbiEi antitoxin C-terminal domain-containing protein n=1 Tax=Cryobacterium sinapicolor TaxID=1259236 RepID=A0ABY2IZS4_9MICO|nr:MULTISPECIES: hypothetical protein [Cryobacterium]TFC87857.1 hypothetical protein E3O67_09030 [Cryobacterium sp. TMT3-29-2]TFC98162.1 hypothetical protein E3T28_11170 [Cryobacterium sinapicolor]